LALTQKVIVMSAFGRRARETQPESVFSRVEKALTVKGILDTDGELHVLGNVLGRIRADRFVLASGGYVEGDIVARDVLIEGRLSGRVYALNVTVDSSADITGRIFHHTVTVARGARVDGRMPWRPLNFFESLKQLAEALP
jgi:cytoskeletal protein CcmA (bactofilin family)